MEQQKVSYTEWLNSLITDVFDKGVAQEVETVSGDMVYVSIVSRDQLEQFAADVKQYLLLEELKHNPTQYDTVGYIKGSLASDVLNPPNKQHAKITK